ncbi:YfiT family bacillithiol transferase [Neolewinella antarctica]|uniref:DinB-like domain-containing protein n=1 Tax=Neolewinella antarctica TaxID=442734 RepID=A0ABX0XAL0_9BACT|nr:putative metal-dependent hydrolase [Neolewinella antarctica]NJC25863.1 hypothetical protein [Neolewinella antarctica]
MQYPIGKFQLPTLEVAAANRLGYVRQIGDLPQQFAEAARNLKARKLLDTTYRPGGWTARQVIHHVCDSHVNAYVRHKRILTEDHPTLTGYDEKRWAELADVTAVPIEVSLRALEALHLRWSVLLATCSPAQWDRTAFHGGAGVDYRLDQLAAQYAWHGRHHLGHLGVVGSLGS